MSTKNQITEIEKRYQFNTDGFSAVDRLGSFVGNRKFSEGFRQMKNGEDSREAYVWNVLSAIGDDIGNVIYSNVANYIDFVSNIDLCKIRALRSMLGQIGIDYRVFDQVGTLPIEVQNLMDILSVNRRYLTDKKVVREELVNSICSSGAIVDILSELKAAQEQISRLNGTAGSDGEKVLQSEVFDDGMYRKFISDSYRNLLSCFLDLEYNLEPARDAVGNTVNYYIRKSPTFLEQYGKQNNPTYTQDLDDEFRVFKLEHGISPSFEQVGIVDDIECGTDSLDNYTGYELELLNKEISRRAGVLTKADLTGRINSFVDTDGNSVLRKTRYSYYRRAKVLEYANFIDNRFLNDTQPSDTNEYGYDSNYFNVDKKNVDGIFSDDGGINEKVLDHVVNYLVNITFYVQKLREKFKLQTRKYYMKGTNLLLRYVINEYLIDYSRANLLNDSTNQFLRSLSSHSIDDIDIVEYFDTTEYFNLSTDYTHLAKNGDDVNKRFWEDIVLNNGEVEVTNAFTTRQIEEFYLNRMLGNNKNINRSNFYDFLDSMYSLGANSSFVDGEAGIFQTTLSGGEHVHDAYPKLVELSDALSVINTRYLSSDEFAYDTTTDMSTQVSVTVNDYIYSNLSVSYYEGVSNLYNEVNPSVDNLSQGFETTQSEYNGLVSGDYTVYFEKSDIKYCYVDNDIGKAYKHDGEHDLGEYFIGNPKYEYSSFRDNLDSLMSFTQNPLNRRNYPVVDTLEHVISNFTAISSVLQTDVVGVINDYGFIDTGTPSLNIKIQSVYDFINKKIDSRLQYLNDTINALKTQANQAREQYDATNNSFGQAVSSYKPSTGSYKLGDSTIFCFSTTRIIGQCATDYYNKENGNVCTGGVNKPTVPYDFVIYCSVNGVYYYGNKGGTGIYGYDKCSITPYDPLGSLEERCAWVQEFINTPTAFDFVYDSDNTYQKQFHYELRSDGIQAAIDTTIQTLGNIKSQYSNIVKQLEILGVKNVPDSTGKTVDDINALILFLNTELDESFIGSDSLVKKYKNLLEKVVQLSSNYTDINDAYDSLFKDSKQVWYFSGYTKIANPTLADLLKLSAYCDEKDEGSHDAITRTIDGIYGDYNGHLNTLTRIANTLSSIEYRVPTLPLEDQIQDVSKTLKADLDMRIYNATMGLATEMRDEVRARFDIIESYLSDILGEKYDFGEKAQEKVDELNFLNSRQYTDPKGMFNRYTGIPGVSDQVAVNHKNKTHPSYQVHPFLWNFIERDDSMVNTLSRSIGSILPSVTPDLLSQFIGRFGQVINVWKTDSQFYDTTGYASRYEVSQNQPLNVDMQTNEVVDYDGAFYPPAVEMLRSDMDGCVASLESRGGDFYRRFYAHLAMNDIEVSRECQRLRDYFTRIRDITDDHDRSSVYDIYRYALDENANSYILYKQYGKDEPSYKEMRNATGELWIRLSEHPFAFPAFTGKSSQAVEVNESTNGAIRKYLNAESGNMKRMRWFYDLHFTRNKQNITLVGMNLDESSGRDASYDNAWVIHSQIRFTRENTASETYVTIEFPTTTSTGERTTDYVACGSNVLTTDNDNINLVGIYPKGTNETWSVYVQNDLSSAGGPSVTMWRSVNSQSQKYVDNEVVANLAYPPISNDWCISYNSKDDNLTFAYIARLDDERFSSGYADNVEFKNADGAVIDDPEETEMNSHDILDGRVVTFDLRLKGRHIQVEGSGVHSYNLNADMSYVPLYPGKRHQSDMSRDGNEFHSIELLGESRNIDYDIGLVNTGVNPYFDYNDFYDSGVFGRVYENYLSAEDKSLWVIRNRAMFRNFPAEQAGSGFEHYGYDDIRGEYGWSICLSDINFVDRDTTREHKEENRYNDHDYQMLQVLIYNRNTLGKNPYFIGPLSSLLLSGETLVSIPIMYSDKGENNERLISSDVFTDGRYCCYSETYGLSDAMSNTGNNRIRGIGSISATYDVVGRKIDIMFIVEDGMKDSAHIPSDTIEVLLYNPYDLTMFEKYHMLDAYGLIKDIRLKDTIKNNVIGDGWQILYDDYMKYSNGELETGIPYYIDERGVRRYLSDVELSGYSYLSDVYILNNEKKLGFKYGEELRFDLSDDAYFYPSLNRKYPKNPGMNASTEMFSTTNASDMEYVKNIFGDRNLFIFNLDSGKDVADSIGNIGMDVDGGDLDDCRVFEDYYDDDNYLKYDDVDPRSLQFVHFAETGRDNSVLSNISDDDYVGKTRDGFIEHMNKTYGIGLYCMKSEEVPDVFNGSSVSFNVDSVNLNLDDSCKLYVNYKKTSSNQITLYFNYFNYLQTPYVKIKDGRMYPDIVDNTYLRLNPGESGILDTVVQFRYYYGNRLCGTKNVKTLSYMIYNTSDDKPKFVVKKIYSVSRDEYAYKTTPVNVSIRAENIRIVSVTQKNVKLDIYFNRSGELDSDIEFYVDYPQQIFSLKSGQYDGYVVNVETGGYAHVKVTRKSLNCISLDVTPNSAEELRKYRNTSYIIGIDKCNLMDMNGFVANVSTTDGSVTVGDL